MKTSHILLFLLILCALPVLGQEGNRPKLGLALSGGGAKGMAHIGVIEAMEKAGLKPDYITGTSMGSLVGALYAIGYTPQQMREVVDTLNWDQLLTNAIPFREVAIEEKPYYGRYIAELPFDSGKVSLPKGLIEGQKLNELFATLTRSVHGINDFNDYPIPFKCIAADILTGKMVELDNGFLPEAMRASMAIPSIFTPVQKDSMLLVDGGIVRNFPVQNVIDMGADIVIGVSVNADPNAPNQIENMVDVLVESAFIYNLYDSKAQRDLCDIFVRPDLTGYSTGSFSDSDSIIHRGKIAGDKYYGVFKNLADSLNSFGERAAIEPVKLDKKYKITNIEFTGNSKYDRGNLVRKFNIDISDSVSISEIEKRIDYLYGTKRYEKVNFSIIPGPNGDSLKVRIKEASRGSIKLSAHFDSENLAGINANFTIRDFIFRQSRTIVEFDLAQNPWIDGSYLKYIGKSYASGLILGAQASRQEVPLFIDDFTAATFRNIYQKYYLGYLTTNSPKFTIGANVFYEVGDWKPQVGQILGALLEEAKNINSGVEGYFTYNNFNKRYYPTKGHDFTLRYVYHFNKETEITSDLEWEFASEYQLIEADWSYYGKISERLTWFTSNSIWLSTLPSGAANFTDFAYVGGFIPRFINSNEYWGASLYEFPMNNYFYSKLGLQWNFISSLYAIGLVNYLDAEYPRAFFESNPDVVLLGDQPRIFGFGAGLGYFTPLGPIQFNLARDVIKNKWTSTVILGFYL